MSGGIPNSAPPYQVKFATMAKKACQAGFTLAELAQLFGVSEWTIQKWRLRHPDFQEAVKVGKDVSDDRVEASLYMRAVGFTYDTERICIVDGELVRVPVVERVVPDTMAAVRWLVNRRPHQWRDKRDVAVTVRAGPPPVDFTGLSIDDLQREYMSSLGDAAEVDGEPLPALPPPAKRNWP